MTRIAKISIVLLLSFGCHHPKTLPESLTGIFADHLRQVDTAMTLDSLRVLFNWPVTQKMGRIFDDSIYVREYSRIKGQLANALLAGDKDSIAFYQYEIHFMEQEIDSIGRAITSGDTSYRYGTLVGCTYYLRGHQFSAMDTTLVFIDTTSTVRYTDYLDSSLRRTTRLVRSRQ